MSNYFPEWFGSRVFLKSAVPCSDLNAECKSILSVDDVSGMKLEITKRIMAGPLYSVETGGSYHLGQDPEQAEKEGMAEFTASVGSQKLNLIGKVNDLGTVTGMVILPEYNAMTQFMIPKAGGEDKPFVVVQVKQPVGEGSLFLQGITAGHGTMGAIGYMQSVTKKLSIGSKLDVNWTEGDSSLAYYARYKDGRTVFTASRFAQAMVGNIYELDWTRFNKCLHFSSQMHIVRGQIHALKFGTMLRYPGSNGSVQASIDTDRQIKFTLTQPLHENVSFNLSGQMHHAKNEFKFATGLTLAL